MATHTSGHFASDLGPGIEQGGSYHIGPNKTAAAVAGASVDTAPSPLLVGVGVSRALGRAFWPKPSTFKMLIPLQQTQSGPCPCPLDPTILAGLLLASSYQHHLPEPPMVGGKAGKQAPPSPAVLADDGQESRSRGIHSPAPSPLGTLATWPSRVAFPSLSYLPVSVLVDPTPANCTTYTCRRTRRACRFGSRPLP